MSQVECQVERITVHGLSATRLRTPAGADAIVCDQGAHVLSWRSADGIERLFASARSNYQAGVAIRGGVPVIFPQFSDRGAGKRHGFARTAQWRFEETAVDPACAQVRYVLDQTDHAWDWPYHLSLLVDLSNTAITLRLEVSNRSEQAWTFNAALHTYLRIPSLAAMTLSGLQGHEYEDQVAAGAFAHQHDALVSIDGEMDRIYHRVAGPLRLTSLGHGLRIAQTGFEDVVVWNPGPAKAAALSDMHVHECSEFVCVEAAQVARAVTLNGGEQWCGEQILTVWEQA